MNDDHPTPEQMFARLKTEGEPAGAAARRGRLKLFFGYAAGVEKTYAMLQAAQAMRKERKDIVRMRRAARRPETEALLDGLECLSALTRSYRGTTLREFGLDAALARRPEIVLVDERARSAPPSFDLSSRPTACPRRCPFVAAEQPRS